MTFLVVTFLKSKKEVEVVPASWTFLSNGTLYTYWPRYNHLDSIKVAVKGADPPNKSNWSKYAIRKLHEFRTYEEAEQKIHHFFENSDLNEDNNSNEASVASAQQSPERSSSSSPESVASKYKLALPALADFDRNAPTDTPKSRPIEERYNVKVKSRQQENLPVYFDSKLKDLEIAMNRKFVELKKNQEEILEALGELKMTMKGASRKQTYSSVDWKNHGLPFGDYMALVEFDRQLEEQRDLKHELILWLSRSGGSTLAEVVNVMMSKVLLDSLALQLTYFGTAVKPSFQRLNLKDIIFEAVITVLDGTDEKQFRTKVQSYLDHAGDRIKAKNNAELKKQMKPKE